MMSKPARPFGSGLRHVTSLALLAAAIFAMSIAGSPSRAWAAEAATEAATETAGESAPLAGADDNAGPVLIERKPDKLRIGFLAGDAGPRLLARLEPFRAYLQQKLDIPVELRAMADWRELIVAQGNAEIDYGIYGASAYVGAWARCQCVEPLVTEEAVDGSTGYYAVMLARTGSHIRTIEDMKGKVLAFGGETSTAGHLLPLAEFAASGIDPQSYFAETKMADNPLDAIRVLMEDKVDGALTWSTMVGRDDDGYGRGPMRMMVDRRTLDMSDVRVIWKSQLIPYGPHAVRSDLAASVKSALRTALESLADDAPDAFEAVDFSGGRRFVAIEHQAYQPLLAVALPGGGDTAPAATDAPANQ